MAGSPMERAETYAEMILEGKVTPAHAALRDGGTHYPGTMEEFREAAITADMEQLRAWLAMAWYCGYLAAQEDRDRRGVTGSRVRK
jgi:hypothetical protein